jgi:hypothetical protein
MVSSRSMILCDVYATISPFSRCYAEKYYETLKKFAARHEMEILFGSALTYEGTT